MKIFVSICIKDMYDIDERPSVGEDRMKGH
jgi:hypothetical protein